MTHALSAAVDQVLANARDTVTAQVAAAAERLGQHPREHVIASVAVDLLTRCCHHELAYAAAEAIVRRAEDMNDEPDPAAPIPYVPALGEIRLASDFDDNRPLGGPRG